MELSEQQLMLLEQLTYFDNKIYEKAGIRYNKDNAKTVGDIVNSFTEENFKKLRSSDFDFAEGNEWEAVIRAIQDDPNLKKLEIADVKKNRRDKLVAICYVNPDDRNKSIVTFRGTTDGDEWKDDALGLDRSDTPIQREALKYIDGLPYSDITVVGHSKGGNKAQYVALLSDKVTRCLSMDGQGFSKEFIEKYWAEIQKNAFKIKNYSLNNDFVHILLYPVPGSKQSFFQGDGIANPGENHAQNSYFQFVEKDGKWSIKKENGEIVLIETEENTSMKYLHEFTCFIMDQLPVDEKSDAAEYIGNCLKLFRGSNDADYVIFEGKKYTPETAMEYLKANKKDASIVIAYLIKYIQLYNLSEEDALDLLRSFGFGDVVDEATSSDMKAMMLSMGYSMGSSLLDLFVSNVSDGERDFIIEAILTWISGRTDFDWVELWNLVENEYAKIPSDIREDANKDICAKSGKVFDFSSKAYNSLDNCISKIENATFGEISTWEFYSSEEWYSSLSIGMAKYGIEKFYSKLTDTNINCKTQIDEIFNEAWLIDNKYSNKIQQVITIIDGVNKMIISLNEAIGLK